MHQRVLHQHFIVLENSSIIQNSMPWILQEEDLLYEQQIAKDPYNELHWLEYAESTSDKHHRAGILDRATATLPASTLLWNAYFEAVFSDKTKLRAAYEKALKVLNTSPSIWTKYLQLLLDQRCQLIKTKFEEALFNVPESYHGDIWRIYIEYAGASWSGESDTAVSLIYTQAIYAKDLGIPNTPNAYKMVDVALKSQNSDIIRRIWSNIWLKKVGPESSKALAEYVLQSGHILELEQRLFNYLVDDYILRLPSQKSLTLLLKARYYEDREIPLARHYYNQALAVATSVKDAVSAFNAYLDFEDSILETLDGSELANRLDILDRFLEKRPFFINDVKLRANPNSVDVWLERSSIFGSDNAGRIKTLVDAIMSINPLQATGLRNLVEIWDEYARIYLDLGDVHTAVLIYSKAANTQFKEVKDLASVHISWTEALLQMSDDAALEHIEDILYNHIPSNHKEIKVQHAKVPIKTRLFKCTELWKFYIDLLKALLEENKPEFVWNKLQVAYQKMVDLEVIILGLIFDYATFLKDRISRDRAMMLYEQALEDFQAPHAQFDLWLVYLKELLESSLNTERIREHFDQCFLTPLPGHLVRKLFDMYLAFESKTELSLKIIRILERAISYLHSSIETPVIKYEKLELYKTIDDKYDYLVSLLTRVGKLKDHELMRSAFQKAAEDPHFSVPQIIDIGLRFIDFEIAQREIVRSRSLFKHFSQLGNPESHLFAEVWSKWERFEVDHGTQETFKEMLRFKRQLIREHAEVDQNKSEVNPMGFVKGETKGGEIKQKAEENPDAIDLDMDM